MVAASALVFSRCVSLSAAARVSASQSPTCPLYPRLCSSFRRRGPFAPAVGGWNSSRVAAAVVASASDTPVPAPSVDPSDPLSQANNEVFDIDGQWLSSTTRHVYIFTGMPTGEGDYIDRESWDTLTIDVDPDSEFNWTDESLQKVYAKFSEVVDQHAGAPLDEYTLRLVGSEVEHFIRSLLLGGEITYNLNSRVLNFSMGRPRVEWDESSD